MLWDVKEEEEKNPEENIGRLQIKKFDATKLFKGSIVCVCAGVCVRRVYHRKFASPEIEFYP